MDEKYYYHKFDLGKRKVTLCIKTYIICSENEDYSILAVGMSVCIPEDEYNEDRGYNIARSAAIKRPKMIIDIQEDMLDKHIINGILLGVEKSMRRKPEKYIAGYKKKKHNCATDAIVQK